MLRVQTIPCLQDNYAYLVLDGADAAVVDPGEAAPVMAALRREGARLREIWCTHHHGDHVGGVPELLDALGRIPVRGSHHDARTARIPGQTHAHGRGEGFRFGAHAVEVLDVPGHTLGAIAFHVDGALFSGDTLFLGGCGRLFEGTAAQMAASMRTLRALPDATRVYPGHEYTVANLRFAAHVEPGSLDITEALARALSTRARGAPTVPGSLEVERRVNPFLRFDRPGHLPELPEDERFAAVRRQKDEFRA